MRGRIEALLLLAFGLGALVFAAGDGYTRLMNPSFRWVTLAGAVLVVLMGTVLLFAPRRAPGRSALLTFGLLALLVIVGRPYAAQGVSLLPPADAPTLDREGYDELILESLFRTLSEEVEDIPEGLYVARGRLHPVPSGDGTTRLVLLYPKVACCLADALAYAVRVDLAQGVAVPEDAAWVHVFGTLRKSDIPIDLPPFRIGAIAFTAVSRSYVFEAEEVVDYRTLLEPVTARIPEVQCAAFRDALQVTGLADVLAGDGPFTVFAPIDSAFLRGLRTLDTDGSDSVDAPRLRRYVEDFVVPESLTRTQLLDRAQVETLSGRTLTIEVVNGRPIVAGARILFADQVGRNGTVHIVHPAWPPKGE